jgi:hypothetical protein
LSRQSIGQPVDARSALSSRAAAAPAPVPVVVGTYNIRADVNLDAFKHAVNAFRDSGVQVAGLQEIGSNERNQWLQENHDWGYYRPPAMQQNPIIWKRGQFDFLSARGAQIAKARDIGGGSCIERRGPPSSDSATCRTARSSRSSTST